MEIAVFGRKGVVSQHVRTLAEEKMAKLGRMAPVLERAEVRMAEDKDAPSGIHRRVCEVTMTGHGHTVRAKAVSRDLIVALDMAAAKVEHQVERLKGKLVDRTHPRKSRLLSQAG